MPIILCCLVRVLFKGGSVHPPIFSRVEVLVTAYHLGAVIKTLRWNFSLYVL